MVSKIRLILAFLGSSINFLSKKLTVPQCGIIVQKGENF
jgi:hypothetical protein